MTKTVKIGIAVVLVVVAIVVIYFLLRKKATANKYGSAEAVAAGTNGTYGAYDPSASSYDYNSLYTSGLNSLIPGDFGGGVYNVDAFGQAWFKGMNIQLNADNINRFKSEVEKFAKDTTLRKAHWDVTKGSFLKSTPIAS